MLKDGLLLMVMGMGTVFVFLSILISAMKITAQIIQRINNIFPEPVPESVKMPVSTTSVSEDEQAEAAIAVLKVFIEKGKRR